MNKEIKNLLHELNNIVSEGQDVIRAMATDPDINPELIADFEDLIDDLEHHKNQIEFALNTELANEIYLAKVKLLNKRPGMGIEG